MVIDDKEISYPLQKFFNVNEKEVIEELNKVLK